MAANRGRSTSTLDVLKDRVSIREIDAVRRIARISGTSTSSAVYPLRSGRSAGWLCSTSIGRGGGQVPDWASFRSTSAPARPSIDVVAGGGDVTYAPQRGIIIFERERALTFRALPMPAERRSRSGR